jgi:hypothetical protein
MLQYPAITWQAARRSKPIYQIVRGLLNTWKEIIAILKNKVDPIPI